MDEQLTASMAETGAETLDAGFDEGFGGEESPVQDLSGAAEETTEAKAETAQAPETDAGESPLQAEEGQTPPQEQPGQELPPEQPVLFHVKYMDEEKTVTAEEAPALIQKGMDYDRIRVKYDEAKPVMEFMSRYARQANLSMGEYLDYLRVEEKKQSGMPEEDARRAVELDNREARVQEAETEAAQAAQRESQRGAAETRMKADIQEFLQEHPDVKPTEIPKEVWDMVRSGSSLTRAYDRHTINQLRLANAAARQRGANAARSTGSMRSAGEDTKSKDPFEEGWDD